MLPPVDLDRPVRPMRRRLEKGAHAGLMKRSRQAHERWYGRPRTMRFGILGPLQVTDGSRTVSLAQGRQRLLLTVLLLHANEAVSTDRLIDALWGESPPPTAARSLHNLVSSLRKGLGDGVLVTEGHGYRMSIAGGELDSQQFAALVDQGRAATAAGDAERAASILRQALALWRGPAFADLAYEPAVSDEAKRLEELRVSALEERIDADLALGRHGEVAPELERLVAQHPLRERLAGQEMLALYRSGRQADALRVFAETRRRMVDDLGIEPGPALRRLEQAVLDQSPELGVPDALPQRPARRSRRIRPVVFAGAGAALGAAAGAPGVVFGGARRTPPAAGTSQPPDPAGRVRRRRSGAGCGGRRRGVDLRWLRRPPHGTRRTGRQHRCRCRPCQRPGRRGGRPRRNADQRGHGRRRRLGAERRRPDDRPHRSGQRQGANRRCRCDADRSRGG